MDLKDLMSEYGVVYLVSVSTDGSNFKENGDKEKVKHQGIVNQYALNMETVGNLNDWLNDSVLPQTISQGVVQCVFTKPKEDVIVCLFRNDESDVITKRRAAKKISEALANIFSGSN